MRAKEFVINVPITIKINGDDDPVVDAGNDTDRSDSKLHQNPIMVAPLQQELELKKAELGKDSPVIDKLTSPDSIGKEPSRDELVQKLKTVLGL